MAVFQTMYMLILFFERTGTGWNLRNVPNGFDEYGFCSICRERNNCPRVDNLHMWRMQQMFVDMSMEEDQLENRQKRFLLYKVHIWYLHGPLGLRNRIPVNQCIELDIKNTFPNLDEEEFVGFTPAEDV